MAGAAPRRATTAPSLAVTHDRYFLDNVAEWIAEVDRGRLYPYEGNYSTYLEKKAERLEVQGKKDAKLAKRLKTELEWVRSNAKAPPDQVQGAPGPLRGDGGRGRPHPQARLRGDPDPAGPAPGQHGHRGRRTSRKGFGDRTLIDGLSFTLPRNGIVGVIGPNGVGKTTLFKTIVGLEEPDAGTVKVGETVKISYVDQSRGGLDPKKNLWETVVRRPGLHPGRQRRDPVSRLRLRSSASRARTSRRWPASCPVVSATGSTWR